MLDGQKKQTNRRSKYGSQKTTTPQALMGLGAFGVRCRQLTVEKMLIVEKSRVWNKVYRPFRQLRAVEALTRKFGLVMVSCEAQYIGVLPRRSGMIGSAPELIQVISKTPAFVVGSNQQSRLASSVLIIK